MINDILDFMAKKAIEVMVGHNQSQVNVELTPSTANKAINLKINKKSFAMKLPQVGAHFTKQNIQHMLDNPMNFKVSSSIEINSLDYEDIQNGDGNLTINIDGADEFAKQFMSAFSKQNASVDIQIKHIPNFDNPRI